MKLVIIRLLNADFKKKERKRDREKEGGREGGRKEKREREEGRKENKREREKLGKNRKCYPLGRKTISREKETNHYLISTNVPVALCT